MNLEILTRADLAQFKMELLGEIKQVLAGAAKQGPTYYKSREVKERLKCSDSTLKSLRDAGEITATKVGGVYYYTLEGLELLPG